MISDIFGPILSGAFNLVGQGINAKYAREMAEQQQLYNVQNMMLSNSLNKDYASWNYTNASMMQRRGLENAGINPILAMANNTGNFMNGSSSALGAGLPTVSDSNLGSNAYQAYLSKKQTEATIKATDSQANLNLSQENVNNVESLLKSEQINTEIAKQKNLDFDSLLKHYQAIYQDKENSYIERKRSAEIINLLTTAKAQQVLSQSSVTNAKANMISANAQDLSAKTGAKWTPVGIGSGLAAGVLGFGMSKIPSLKYLKKKKVGF